MTQHARSALRRLNVRASKERGQNFLINEEVLDSIIAFGAPSPKESLLEIGPGLGALTKRLFPVAPLALIEIEPNFCRELARQYPGVRILNEDVRKVDFTTLGKDLVVFGNLPYSFSTDIIFHLVSQRACVRRAILMLQREFAERVGADPGGRDYGVLSISLQLWADVRLGPIISGDSFHPPAHVESRILELTFLSEPRFPVPDLGWFRRVVQASFSQRRRKILNSLKATGFFTSEKIIEALSASGIDGSRRAETVSISEFVTLAEKLRDGD